jgi:uncharacterized membrane protein (DUF106 family)
MSKNQFHFLLCLTIILLVIFYRWVVAGFQRDQYAKQGVHISQFEVFIGVKPIVTTVAE